MPLDETAHLQRDRAESFGAIAGNYDRYRPTYPSALVDDLVASVPSVAAAGPRASVLDVGCGTGKAARLLRARGLSVVGVEVDPQMAAVAAGHGVPVEVSAFETWDERGRSFDLILSAQAWHWVDPVVAVPKARGLLRAGGSVALFWNDDEAEEPVYSASSRVYERLEPQLWREHAARSGHDLDRYAADLKRYGGFTDVRIRRYEYRRREPVADWIARCATHSDHLLLGAQRLGELTAALYEALTEALTDASTETPTTAPTTARGRPDPVVVSCGGTSVVQAFAPA